MGEGTPSRLWALRPKEEEEEEDRAFTNISLADDTGKEETDDF